MIAAHPGNTIVVDVGHCGGKMCEYASLLGYRAVGIGKCNLVSMSVCCVRDHVCFLFVESVRTRWALSVTICQQLVNSRVLDGQSAASVSLLNVDANTVNNFNFASAPNKDVVVYCWNRGLSPDVYKNVVQAAARSPRVKGASVWYADATSNCCDHLFCSPTQALYVRQTLSIPASYRSQQSVTVTLTTSTLGSRCLRKANGRRIPLKTHLLCHTRPLLLALRTT